MQTTRRTLLGMAAAAGGAALPIARGHAAPFQWANCASGTSTSAFATANSTTRVATFADWRLGDCELHGARITLSSNGTGAFQAQVCTHFTHSKDIWHFGVELIGDALNSPNFYTLFSWNGPQMSEQDRPLFHTWSEIFKVDPQLFKQVTHARATSCC